MWIFTRALNFIKTRMMRNLTLFFIGALIVPIEASQKLDHVQANKMLLDLVEQATRDIKVGQTKSIIDSKSGSKSENGFATSYFYIPKTSDETKYHAMDLIVQNVGSEMKVVIKNTKKDNVIKSMEGFVKEEWNLQKDAFKELIVDILNHKSDLEATTYDPEEDENNKRVHFATIQDVKEAIKKHAGSNQKLRFVDKSSEDFVRFEIFSRESLIGFVMIKVEKIGSNNYMKIEVTPSQENAKTEEFSIKMVDTTNQAFKVEIDKICNVLITRNQFKNNEEHMDYVINYLRLKKKYNVTRPEKPSQKVDSGDDNADFSNEMRKTFTIVYDHIVATAELLYNEPTNHSSPATYSFNLSVNGMPVDIKPYSRMTQDNLDKMLDEYNLDKYFVSVRDEIFQIFEDKVRTYFGNTMSVNFPPYTTEGSMFGSQTFKKLAVSDRVSFTVLDYQESNGKVVLKITAQKGFKFTFDYSFMKSMYKASAVIDIFDFLFKSSASECKRGL